MNPTTEAGWLHKLDMAKSEAYLLGYAKGQLAASKPHIQYIEGRLAGLREAQDIATGASTLVPGYEHDFDNGWAAASVQIAQAIGFAQAKYNAARCHKCNGNGLTHTQTSALNMIATKEDIKVLSWPSLCSPYLRPQQEAFVLAKKLNEFTLLR